MCTIGNEMNSYICIIFILSNGNACNDYNSLNNVVCSISKYTYTHTLFDVAVAVAVAAIAADLS